MDLWTDNLWKLVGGLFVTAALSACGTQPPHIGTPHTVPISSESGLVKSLQKQLRERDKRIEELESQLDALKVIDQDVDKRKKFFRPPAALTPIE